MNIVIDPDLPGDQLREQLFAGNLVILTRLQALADFVEYTREELTELFKPYEPEFVHEHIEPAEMAKILGVWKSRFIHSERSKKLVRAVIEEAGFRRERGRREQLRRGVRGRAVRRAARGRHARVQQPGAEVADAFGPR